jgi:hypothetical protein
MKRFKIFIVAMLTPILICALLASCGDKEAKDARATDEKDTTTPSAITTEGAVTTSSGAAIAEDETKPEGDAGIPAPAGEAPGAVSSSGNTSNGGGSAPPTTAPSGESPSVAPTTPATPPANNPPPDENLTVTISIDCVTLLGVDPDLAARVSSGGVILDGKSVTLKKGATVYDVIKASGVSSVGQAYISVINSLGEGDGGPRSGWVYSVNGTFPNKGITAYMVANGDRVAFRFTCDGGNDVR